MKKDVKTKENSVDLKEVDLEQAFDNDMTAAIALLNIIRTNPEVRGEVLKVLEKYRMDAVKHQNEKKKQTKMPF